MYCQMAEPNDPTNIAKVFQTDNTHQGGIAGDKITMPGVAAGHLSNTYLLDASSRAWRASRMI